MTCHLVQLEIDGYTTCYAHDWSGDAGDCRVCPIGLREAAAAALARVRERVVAIDTFGIFDPAGYRIDSAPAMRAAVLAIIEEEAGR